MEMNIITSGITLGASIAFSCIPFTQELPHSINTKSQYYRDFSGSNGIDISAFSERTGSSDIVHNKVDQYLVASINFPSHIEKIKATFNLTDNELAKIIDVSRKTLYNWKQKVSEAGSEGMRQRVFELYLLAQNWCDYNFPNKKSDLEIPVFQNLSIKQLLLEKKLDSKKILFAGSRLNLRNNGNDLF